MAYGGIYVDTDFIFVRSLTPLLRFQYVLGEENIAPGYFNAFEEYSQGNIFGIAGLPNAFIVSSPDSKFLQEWYQSYTSFNHRIYDFQSCDYPLEMAKRGRSDLLTLSTEAVYSPQTEDIPRFFVSPDWPLFTNFGIHLYHKLLGDMLSEVSLERIFDVRYQDSFSKLARYVLRKNVTAELSL